MGERAGGPLGVQGLALATLFWEVSVGWDPKKDSVLSFF